jgi:hypothetical protein
LAAKRPPRRPAAAAAASGANPAARLPRRPPRSNPPVPRRYQGARYTRERYLEGWQDGRAGRPHAHAAHAEQIIQHQGQAQYDAYTAGHAAGRDTAAAEPGVIAWVNAMLDDLERAPLAALDSSRLAVLAARLRRMADLLDSAARPAPPPPPD